jgi:hypothetical protein
MFSLIPPLFKSLINYLMKYRTCQGGGGRKDRPDQKPEYEWMYLEGGIFDRHQTGMIIQGSRILEKKTAVYP